MAPAGGGGLLPMLQDIRTLMQMQAPGVTADVLELQCNVLRALAKLLKKKPSRAVPNRRFRVASADVVYDTLCNTLHGKDMRVTHMVPALRCLQRLAQAAYDTRARNWRQECPELNNLLRFLHVLATAMGRIGFQDAGGKQATILCRCIWTLAYLAPKTDYLVPMLPVVEIAVAQFEPCNIPIGVAFARLMQELSNNLVVEDNPVILRSLFTIVTTVHAAAAVQSVAEILFHGSKNGLEYFVQPVVEGLERFHGTHPGTAGACLNLLCAFAKSNPRGAEAVRLHHATLRRVMQNLAVAPTTTKKLAAHMQRLRRLLV
jgi:hypothetical protein